jgi:hypothetical protein
MIRLLKLCLVLGLIGVTPARAADQDWATVAIAPVKTSIYVGSVTLTTSDFRRDGEKFTATYDAKVWPWFFWSESGDITIDLPQETLDRLARGERVEFSGSAFNQKRKPRYVTGRAERTGPGSGTIKVRIGVDDTELVFNSTYRVLTGGG